MQKNDVALLGGMAGVLAILIFAVFGLSVFDSYLLRSPSLAAVVSAALVDLTNGDRGANNLGRLAISSTLTAAAQAKAADMAANGYFAHTSPDGKNSWHWFKQAGYTFLYAGENLAVDFSDSANVEQAWMDSPTHRANILDGHFTEVGIATARGAYEGRPTTFVVQMFGTPAGESAPVARVQADSLPAEPTEPALATTASTPSIDRAQADSLQAASAKLVLGAGADSILPTEAPWWQWLVASPATWLRYVYYALGFITLILLAFVTGLEFHRRHLRHVAVAAFLFLFMAGLFAFANTVFFAPPTLASL